MEINELMVGDWVNIAIEEYNNPTRIKEIGLFWVKVIKDKMEYSNILVTPIPLTTEILEKYGFLYEVANAFAMTTEGMTIGLQNVHELQHLFKLCGITKKIDL